MNLQLLTAKFLEGMGEAEPHFEPSPFQLKAIRLLERGEDVIVVAPTGSGKTWIAQEIMKKYLEEGKRCWYTTPLKALSNQKYDSFRKLFGDDNVGLLTGERKENPTAPILVATTEIFRNHLYSYDVSPALLVLDEAHYISDPERGTTWEEIIILSPPEIQLLLLSATITNADEIREWMWNVRGKQPQLVTCETRPVPLRVGFLTSQGYVISMEDATEELCLCKFEPVEIVKSLERFSLLPSIIFLPRRRDCDRAARAFRGITAEGRKERQEFFRELLRELPSLANVPFSKIMVDAGVAPHHAGHLTSWKIAVERMLSAGLLRAVFSTSTLAAGLDVPARTVVLPESTIRGGLLPLSSLEFHQMVGRAGRRGKDKIGFALFCISKKRGFHLATRLANSKPEKLVSAFRISYYQVLNLVHRYGYWGAKELIQKSLYIYQKAKLGHKNLKRAMWELEGEFDSRVGVLIELGYISDDYVLTSNGNWAKEIRHTNSIFIAESLRSGMLKHMNAAELCGWAAALSGEDSPSNLVEKVNLHPLLTIAKRIAKLERRYALAPSGFIYEVKGKFCPAALKASAMKAWYEGIEWKDLVILSQSDEGDLQRLVIQTLEVLKQIESLPFGLHEKIQQIRRNLLRPPVSEFF